MIRVGRIFILLLYVFGLFSGHAFSQDKTWNKQSISHSNEMKCNKEKMYIIVDQLIISDQGMYVLLEDENGTLTKILVSQINSDNDGIFVLAENVPTPQAAWCRMGHKACDRCGRCSYPGCPTRPCQC